MDPLELVNKLKRLRVEGVDISTTIIDRPYDERHLFSHLYFVYLYRNRTLSSSALRCRGEGRDGLFTGYYLLRLSHPNWSTLTTS